jgi:hypothetical protein
VRRRSLLWAGPGVVLIGARPAEEDDPLAASHRDGGPGEDGVVDEGGAATPASGDEVPPAAPVPYPRSRVTKTKG